VIDGYTSDPTITQKITVASYDHDGIFKGNRVGFVGTLLLGRPGATSSSSQAAPLDPLAPNSSPTSVPDGPPHSLDRHDLEVYVQYVL
jgi:hypothetical protein